MKIPHILLVFAILLQTAAIHAKGPGGQGMGGQMNRPATAGGGMGPQGRQPTATPSASAGMSTLERFLQLNDEQLAQLEEVIQRIRKMTPEEREAYRQKIIEYSGMAPEQRANLQSAWGQMDERVKSAWRTYMQALDSAQHEAIRAQMLNIPFEERNRWRIEKLVEAGLLSPDEAKEVTGAGSAGKE
jgi:hypothetical protein